MRILAFSLLIIFFLPLASSAASPGEVNLINCSIFDASGNLLRKYSAWMCAFFPNGKMLLGDGLTVTFYDQKMNIVWSKDVHTHNQFNYSAADQTALVIASIILPGNLRSERLEVYSKDGKLTKHFNFTSPYALTAYPFSYDRFVLPTRVRTEVTHVESFNRIPKNHSRDRALQEGNYVAADAQGVLYFFDNSLKKVLRKVDLTQWNLRGLHDVQITNSGTLLFYRNENRDEAGNLYSSLEERDLENGKLLWRYTAKKPTKFFTPYEGNVQLLPNGNVLFSEVLNERLGKERVEIAPEVYESWMDVQGNHQAVEIKRDGTEVWRMISKDDDLSGKPNVVKRQNLAGY